METKQEYKILYQEAWASNFLIDVEFEYKGNVYKAKSQYVNGGWGLDPVDVLNDLDEYVYDEDVVEIGEKLIYDMDINKDTITF